MQITNDLGETYQASEMKVEMVKTILVTVHLDELDQLAEAEVSEEALEQIAHEEWLEAQGILLRTIEEGFPYIDIEFFSTDHVQLEVVE